MPRIEIGAGIMLGVAAALGWLNDLWALIPLGVLAIWLVAHGAYDEWVKPRFRVEHRLAGWLIRRSWSVGIERQPNFNFILHLTSPESEKHIYITREKAALNDVLAFTARIGLHPQWIPTLMQMPDNEKSRLIQEITIFLSQKGIGLILNDPRASDSTITWPPDVKVQAAIAQDHTLTQHSVDATAKKVESAMIGVRAIIRKALLDTSPDRIVDSSPSGADRASTLRPSHESILGRAWRWLRRAP